MSHHIYNDENADPALRGKPSTRSVRGVLGDLTNGGVGGSRPGYRASATATATASTTATARPRATLPASPVTDIDFGDELDPQLCSEYVEEIFACLVKAEPRYQPSATYMSHQPDINDKMRTILFDWLVDVHLKFKLLPETLYLTFNYVDRFLERKAVSRQRLQLVGVTCLLIASKYEEIYAPEVRDCVYITDKAYTKQEIYRMERHVLATLGFNMTAPNAGSYLKRFIKAAGGDSRLRMAATYYCELAMQDYGMLRHPPSLLVAAAVSVALRGQRRRAWTPTLERYTGYSESGIAGCAADLTAVVKRAATATQYTAVRNKFSSAKFLEVAKLPVAEL